MMQTAPETVRGILNDQNLIDRLCQTTLRGMIRYYPADSDRLPYTTRIDPMGQWVLSGDSFRYAAIAQIGIARWLRYHPQDQSRLPDVWPRLVRRCDSLDDLGDTALAIWAGAETQAEEIDRFIRVLQRLWPQKADSCNAVELAWVLMACTVVDSYSESVGQSLLPLRQEVHRRLMGLFHGPANLFQRHSRKSLAEVVSRRVACFADQVYPIQALATYGQRYRDNQSVDIAARAVDQICRYQGPQGQWQWHYDVVGCKVCEEYPVFSVHQEAMAPMAILAGDAASQQDHWRQILLGAKWLFGDNELKTNMVLEDQGLVWRDIERNDRGKWIRNIRGFFCVAKWNGLHHAAANWCKSWRINRECRPYELGWILYAWADRGLK